MDADERLGSIVQVSRTVVEDFRKGIFSFSYQRAGVKWLWDLHGQKCGGIIADEMGLGKVGERTNERTKCFDVLDFRRFKSLLFSPRFTTVESETRRIRERKRKTIDRRTLRSACRYRGLGPVLIVCPSTLLHQWVHEFHQWWPEFRVAVLHESGSFQGKKGVGELPAILSSIALRLCSTV